MNFRCQILCFSIWCCERSQYDSYDWSPLARWTLFCLALFRHGAQWYYFTISETIERWKQMGRTQEKGRKHSSVWQAAASANHQDNFTGITIKSIKEWQDCEKVALRCKHRAFSKWEGQQKNLRCLLKNNLHYSCYFVCTQHSPFPLATLWKQVWEWSRELGAVSKRDQKKEYSSKSKVWPTEQNLLFFILLPNSPCLTTM